MSTSVVKTVEMSKAKTPLLPGPPTHLLPMPSSTASVSMPSELVYRTAVSVPYSSNFVNYTNPPQVWQNGPPQNLPPNYTQYHPQGQMPVPMVCFHLYKYGIYTECLN